MGRITTAAAPLRALEEDEADGDDEEERSALLRFDLETMAPARLPMRLRELLALRVRVLEPLWAEVIVETLLGRGGAACIDLAVDPDLLADAVTELRNELTGTTAAGPADGTAAAAVRHIVRPATAAEAGALLAEWLPRARAAAREGGGWRAVQRSASTVTHLDALMQELGPEAVGDDIVVATSSDSASGALLTFSRGDGSLTITRLVSPDGPEPQRECVGFVTAAAAAAGMREVRMSPLVTATLWGDAADFGFTYPSLQAPWLTYRWLAQP